MSWIKYLQEQAEIKQLPDFLVMIQHPALAELLAEIEDREREAFEAGRAQDRFLKDGEVQYDYPTFEDYKREQEK